ncbi:CLUMA_CG018601, isoform A [Clunio marinus]|uniref:CLUMA_CG018601, isoform A n=1 Tax=Clunio marinus TaxID=568069 RepID=A0A1J1J009_9DIPT|nr:CLUMA_CG018601, isoform A [Clunio marinus]
MVQYLWPPTHTGSYFIRYLKRFFMMFSNSFLKKRRSILYDSVLTYQMFTNETEKDVKEGLSNVNQESKKRVENA